MRPRNRLWAVGLMASACLLVGAIAAGVFAWAERESVDAIHLRLEQAAPWLLLWRVSLFSVLVVYWREFAGWIANIFSLDSESRAELVHWRWRAAAGLLFMDLVLVEDVIGQLQRAVS